MLNRPRFGQVGPLHLYALNVRRIFLQRRSSVRRPMVRLWGRALVRQLPPAEPLEVMLGGPLAEPLEVMLAGRLRPRPAR